MLLRRCKYDDNLNVALKRKQIRFVQCEWTPNLRLVGI